jgi:SAM-dependent methyltransferase
LEQHRIWDHFQTTGVDSFEQARGRYQAIAGVVRRVHGRAGRVLNIGIGSGGLERLLVQQGWQVASLDPSPAAVEAMRALGLEAHCAMAQQMPLEDQRFDVVVASEVLEHLQPEVRAQALREVARVLQPGGWFVGSVPYREVLRDQEVVCPDCGKVFHRWGHVSSFDLDDIRRELGAVFGQVRCGRRAFVDWQAARTPMKLLKAVAHGLLGRLGEPIASPSIVFVARRAG